MESKQIKINPNFFKVDREKKKPQKTHSPEVRSVKSSDIKKKLIGKIKNYQAKQQKNIMFKEGTERPFSSDLLNEKRKGFYHCANCGNKLFASTSKFDSGTGWPSFSKALPNAFNTKIDYSFGMKRIEYHCAKCGVHHGHVFDDGPKASKKRFCNNGLCLIFKPE